PQVLHVRQNRELPGVVIDAIGIAVLGVPPVVVLGIHEVAGGDLLHVGETGRLTRLLARLGKYREKNRREDGDDGYHHQQLDQREAAASGAGERAGAGAPRFDETKSRPMFLVQHLSVPPCLSVEPLPPSGGLQKAEVYAFAVSGFPSFVRDQGSSGSRPKS